MGHTAGGNDRTSSRIEARPEREHLLTLLRWCRTCNEEGIGFLGPTVWRHGPLPEYVYAIEDGLVRCVDPPQDRRTDRRSCGYWLTDRGLATLSALLADDAHRASASARRNMNKTHDS